MNSRVRVPRGPEILDACYNPKGRRRDNIQRQDGTIDLGNGA